MNEAREKGGAGLRILSHVVCHFAVLLLLSSAVAFWIAVPRFKEMFADLETPLPTVTVWLLSIPPIAAFGAAALLSALLVVMEVVVKRRGVTLMMSLLVLLVTVVFDVVMVVGLFVPLVRTVESLA